MTHCYADGIRHDFPVEDSTGAHCPEHGVTLLWHGPPIADADLSPTETVAEDTT